MAKPNTKKLYMKIVFEGEPNLEYEKILGTGSKHKRSNVTVAAKNSKLIIEITASDATALRASVNSVLRDLQVIEASKIA
ncbi:MAG: KEOPS complex subunit Pcc1 [Candidatus Micrarchaeaceae archaeon]